MLALAGTVPCVKWPIPVSNGPYLLSSIGNVEFRLRTRAAERHTLLAESAMFYARGHVQVPAAWKILQVQPCSLGQITADRRRACTLCGISTFPLDPLNQSCDPCPPGASCFGGDAFIPLEHSWHSSPMSTTIVGCPNADGCKGDRNGLLVCKQVSPQSLAFPHPR